MKTLPVAAQVYSIRDTAEADFSGAMRLLKGMGYNAVELAGLYGHTAGELRAILDDLGIEAISAHVPLAEMQADIGKVIEDYRTLGCRYLGVPYLDESARPGAPRFAEILRDIARIGDACHAAGLTLLYHNHDFEFIRMPDGSFGFDYIYASTTPEQLQVEPDTCWIKVAGQDPAAYIRKYAGRVPVIHLKDYWLQATANVAAANLAAANLAAAGKMYNLIGMEKEEKPAGQGQFAFRPLGQGLQDIPAILAASIDAGAQYVVAEQDESTDGRTRLEAAAISRQYLRSLGW
jgi:sugar phosphate isomerase/epimerase